MMINILSLRCSLAFASYLSRGLGDFLLDGVVASQVVRQGGSSLILRSDGDLVLRHQHRQASLCRDEARHYAATVRMRCEFYNVSRLQDEVVLADVGEEIFLSYPQSEMWLTRDAISSLWKMFRCVPTAGPQHEVLSFPEWLKVSTGGGRLLLSDQRTARWVLLGEDHLQELERRVASLRKWEGVDAVPSPPTISIKGLTVHLQSATKLAETLEELLKTGRVTPFEESAPTYSLRASASTEGIELRDANIRIALTAREARKWLSIIREELVRLKVHCVERGGIRTVFAGNDDGTWILQWGDEIFVDKGEWLSSAGTRDATGCPIAGRIDELLVFLNPRSGSCVALTDSESKCLDSFDQFVDRTGRRSEILR
jgi:hypothetical protein